jgi:excinuclease ABC subunit C
VDALFTRNGFDSFGPSRLDPTPPVLHSVHGHRKSLLRNRVRDFAPRRPGVYGMVDADGKLIYLGKAKCLRTRLLSYFRSAKDDKAAHIVGHARTIAWEGTPTEFAALLRELELIRRWQPRFNVQGQPGRRRRTFVCLGRRPTPYVFLSRQPPANVLACFGPVPSGNRAREAVRRVNDLFRLRDCPQSQPMIFAEQVELFPVLRAAGCLRHEIGTCLGPCAAACSQTEYQDEVQAARAFLAGQERAPLVEVEKEMTEAAAALHFERAGALRDKLETLRWLGEQLDRVRWARERHSFIYPIRGWEGEDRWYLIHGGQVRAVLPPPIDNRKRQALAGAIEFVYGKKLPAPQALAIEQVDGVLLVAGWFHRHPEERERTMKPAEVLAACV